MRSPPTSPRRSWPRRGRKRKKARASPLAALRPIRHRTATPQASDAGDMGQERRVTVKVPWLLSAILVPLVVAAAAVLPSTWLVIRFGQGYANATLPRPRPEAMTTLLYDRAGHLIGSLD